MAKMMSLQESLWVIDRAIRLLAASGHEAHAHVLSRARSPVFAALPQPAQAVDVGAILEVAEELRRLPMVIPNCKGMARTLAAQGQGDSAVDVGAIREVAHGLSVIGNTPDDALRFVCQGASEKLTRAIGNAQAEGVGDAVVEEACRAFYETHGESKWAKLLECWKEKHRSAMRNAIAATKATPQCP
jgi:hypothetical protein